MPLRAIARVNLAAVERNVIRLRRLARTSELGAVVKADAYGHGAVPVARAALAGGAGWLVVATAEEAAELRAAGIDSRLLVIGAVSADELPVALAARADLVAWSEQFVTELERAKPDGRAVRVHVKLDTGMGRLGTREVEEATAIAARAARAEGVMVLAGAMTHFATADEDPEFLAQQLARFVPFAEKLRALAPGVVVHAANSAATLRAPASHFDMVRCGIAIYGGDPMNQDPSRHELEPALELCSYVAAVKRAHVGDSVGYGRRFVAPRETWIGTLPLGYGDGLRRALTDNCDVIVAGARYPLIGTVSMDNITIDLGAETSVRVGEVATIIGPNGSERQTAEDLAHRLATINYEILCGISKRVPRVYHRDGGQV